MVVTRKRAQRLGLAAIGGIIALQAFNSFACYDHDVAAFLMAVGVFLAIPLATALVSLLSANPLRAVGACLLFAPWLALAFHTDCIRPYTGGGASMIYVAVLFWGTPSAILGALVTGPVMRLFNISICSR